MMYRVIWTIDIEADSPQEAARKALKIQRNPKSTATVFEVEWRHRDDVSGGMTIDLGEYLR